MKKGLFLGGTLCALLLTVTSVQANITAALDSPAEGPVSGNDLLSGWAFATVDGANVDVTVTVFVDGVTQNEVLCCGPRADVQANVPGAPLNTGFAGLIPYGELAQGPHTIGVLITAPGCDDVVLNRSIQVIKPGNASFIQNLDFSGATFTGLSDGFDATGVGVTSADGTVSDDVEATYSLNSQSILITGPEPIGVDAFYANLNGLQEVNVAAASVSQPIVDTTANGAADFTLNGTTLNYRVEVRDIPGMLFLIPDVGAAHIHQAAAGANGAIAIPLEPTNALPTGPPFIWEGQAELDQTQLDALNAGELYVNVHTVENMGGEVRGQIVAAPTCATRSVFAGAPVRPDGQGQATGGCRQFTDEASCLTGYQLDPANRDAVECLWNADFMVCGACGPMLQNQSVCTNGC